MITKKDIDNYITKNYDDIIEYIKAMIYRHRLKEEPEYFFSELYLNLIKKKKTFNDEIHLKNYISNFIYNNGRWYNSPVREMGNIVKANRVEEFVPENHDEEDCTEKEIEQKLFQEFELYEHQGINELYYQQLTCLEMKVAWEIVFVHKMYSTRKFGAYVGRSKSVGSRYINMLKADMKKFYIVYKEKNKDISYEN